MKVQLSPDAGDEKALAEPTPPMPTPKDTTAQSTDENSTSVALRNILDEAVRRNPDAILVEVTEAIRTFLKDRRDDMLAAVNLMTKRNAL